jgi:hypothetical protein
MLNLIKHDDLGEWNRALPNQNVNQLWGSR